MVTVILGTRFSFCDRVAPQAMMGNALVLKLPAAVCVRMTELLAGMVKLPHRLNTALERCRSTTTLSIVMGEEVVLSSRIAPAVIGDAPPRPIMLTLGAPCQGMGKLALALVWSANPTDTAT